MEGKSLIVFEVIVSAVVPLGFGFWQLWSLRREKRRDAEKAALRAEAPRG